MKLRTILTIAGAVMLTGGMARAVHVWEDPQDWTRSIFVYDTTTKPVYSPGELSLDLSASYIAGESHIGNLFETDIKHDHGRWGGNVGLNYFFTRYIGIGGDIQMTDNRGAFIDQALGSLILRVPIGSTGLAPYVFGGGGRGFDPSWEWLGDIGAGLEFRFNPTAGIFADGRYIWADKSFDRLLLRAGLRLAF